MHARLQLYVWMAILVFLGLGSTAYKHLSLGFPLVPGKTTTVWTVEAKMNFVGLGQPVKVSLNLPEDTENLIVVESRSASPGFGFQRSKSGPESHGVWSARAVDGAQTLYYQVRVYRGDGKPYLVPEEAPKRPKRPEFSEPVTIATDAVLADAFARSADAETLAVRLVQKFNSKDPGENVRALKMEFKGSSAKNQLLVDLLHAAEVPARLLRGIDLSEVGRHHRLRELIEIFNGENWVVIDPTTGDLGISETFLPWQRAGQWLLQVEGGRKSEISFSVNADERAASNVALYLGREQHAGLVDFSIFSLPVDVQNTFAILLLIPVGALVVVILRNLVGIRTSGTFMPILIALSFVQTTLLTGLILFLVVVGAGLLVRGYLSRLNLLLVPRIASVIIVVIALYVWLSILGFKMGVTEVLSVTFFPMIIISWTIERMSVLWEEEGAKEVVVQGGGSLLTAIIVYLVMTEHYTSYLFFAFPEMLLVVLAIILAIGQYSGFRLTELRRFEPLTREES